MVIRKSDLEPEPFRTEDELSWSSLIGILFTSWIKGHIGRSLQDFCLHNDDGATGWAVSKQRILWLRIWSPILYLTRVSVIKARYVILSLAWSDQSPFCIAFNHILLTHRLVSISIDLGHPDSCWFPGHWSYASHAQHFSSSTSLPYGRFYSTQQDDELYEAMIQVMLESE